MIKQSFDAQWELTEGVAMFIPNPNTKWQPVTLPHDLSIEKPRSSAYLTGGGGGYAWGGVVTYRKTFEVPADWQGRSVQLEFEGVYMNAEVSINGNLAALHPYGYTSFLVDLTPYLKIGAENVVSVLVNNAALPNSRWYSGTGIYRHVWLRMGEVVRIRPWGVFVTTPVVDPAASTVSVATEIEGAPAAGILRSSVLDASGAVVAQVETPFDTAVLATVSQSLEVKPASLWTLEQPALYTLLSEVLVGGQMVDSEQTSFGIRKIEIDAQQGFRLNGVPMKLKGGCIHHDNGLLGAASYDRAEERKIELLQASGYNAVRCAHNPPAPSMLDACDRLGMLVIDETFDCWRMGKNPHDYHLYFEDWWQRDTESMVLRDRNHPSIFMWSIGNEVPERTGVSDGYEWCRKQVNFVRALDATRPVTSAVPFLFETPDPDDEPTDWTNLIIPAPKDPNKDRWGRLTRDFNAALDVVGYNYLYARYEHDATAFPGRVICGTETFPAQAFDYWKETDRLPHVIGDFVWTAWDYLGESGIGRVYFDEPVAFFGKDQWPYHLATCGDIDICGFKRPQSYFRDLLWGVRTAPYIAVLEPKDHGKKTAFTPWGWEPVVESWTFPGWEGKPTRVEVYSLDDEVELWVNGKLAGRQPAGAANKNKAVFEVIYQPGALEAVGFSGGKETARTCLASTDAPAALRLTTDRASLSGAGDLAYVTVELVDASGARVPYANAEVSVEISGPAQLIALGAADPLSEALYTACQRSAFEGRLMAVVCATGQPGEVEIKATAAELGSAAAKVTVS